MYLAAGNGKNCIESGGHFQVKRTQKQLKKTHVLLINLICLICPDPLLYKFHFRTFIQEYTRDPFSYKDNRGDW